MIFTYLTSMSVTKRARKVNFHTWFYKWKISRSHANGNFLSKNIGKHSCNRKFEMSHTYSFIHNNSFYLIKRIIMCSINIFIPKYTSRNNRSNRSIFVSHDKVLHTWCLCCENLAFSLKPESILHIASWMIFATFTASKFRYSVVISIDSYISKPILVNVSSISWRTRVIGWMLPFQGKMVL